MNRLKKKYNNEVLAAMEEQFKFNNDYAVPKITKVVLNIGTSQALKEPKVLEVMRENLAQISGQKAIATRAKKAISGFNIREKMIIGLKVTLRGERMHEFLDKFVNITLPRVRDFQGLPAKSLDQLGNLTVGIKECTVFPEINPNKVEIIHGLEVSITNTAQNKEEGYALFKLLGFPLREK